MQPWETELEPHLAKFISLICNVSMMKQHMMEIGGIFKRFILTVCALTKKKKEKRKRKIMRMLIHIYLCT